MKQGSVTDQTEIRNQAKAGVSDILPIFGDMFPVNSRHTENYQISVFGKRLQLLVFPRSPTVYVNQMLVCGDYVGSPNEKNRVRLMLFENLFHGEGYGKEEVEASDGRPPSHRIKKMFDCTFGQLIISQITFSIS